MLKKILFSLCALIATCSFLGAAERTLSIIKPDAVKANQIGEIIARFEANQLRIAGMKMKLMTKQEAMDFYAEHKERPFYTNLTDFMSSGPVVVMVLEGDHAIKKNREIMGATDPAQAAKGTIRKDFAKSKEQNAVHGSDSPASAEREIKFFFKPGEVQNR